jgi:hypothetical protein
VQFTFKDANDQIKLGKNDNNSDTSNSSDDEDGKPSRIVNKKKDFLSPKFAGSKRSSAVNQENGELMTKLMKINGNPGSATLKRQNSNKQQSSHKSCHSSIMDQISENKFKTEMVMNPK